MAVNRFQQKFGPDAIRRRLQGMVDPRSHAGILSRGANVYNGVSNAAHSGGGLQYGRPQGSGDVNQLQSAATRRMSRTQRPYSLLSRVKPRQPGPGLVRPVIPMIPPVGNRNIRNRRMMPYG